ncbi:MAG: hypothetical protein KDK12_15755 [Rhodobacteraceae bacterium]|nr:hypothetical protein [Paracoccaceae bacterium]
MLTANFRVAMLNRITLAPYYAPTQPDGQGFEWLIVEREGALLRISDGSRPADGSESAAPDDLQANNTLVSVMIDAGAGADTFLFMRHLPPPTATEGSFFPADGYARLARDAAGQLTLEAHGRHALLSEIRGGQAVHIDVPVPPKDFAGARTWHFAATQKPWTQQLI